MEIITSDSGTRSRLSLKSARGNMKPEYKIPIFNLPFKKRIVKLEAVTCIKSSGKNKK